MIRLQIADGRGTEGAQPGDESVQRSFSGASAYIAKDGLNLGSSTHATPFDRSQYGKVGANGEGTEVSNQEAR